MGCGRPPMWSIQSGKRQTLRRQSVRGTALVALSQSAASRALIIVRDFLAAPMLLKASSSQRRQLEYSTHALIQPKVPNPSPARAPADRSGVKRVATVSELLHEPDFVFPRPSQFSRCFHPAASLAKYDPRAALSDAEDRELFILPLDSSHALRRDPPKCLADLDQRPPGIARLQSVTDQSDQIGTDRWI